MHLSERLAYERAVHKQRMNTEIAQAKRESNFFSQNVELNERLAKRKVKGNVVNPDSPALGETRGDEVFLRQYKQRDLDSEILERKLKSLEPGSVKIKKKKKSSIKKQIGPLEEETREDFLKSIFGSRK